MVLSLMVSGGMFLEELYFFVADGPAMIDIHALDAAISKNPGPTLDGGWEIVQRCAAFFILRAIGIHNLYLEYMVLFLLSSIVAVLPFTIGGIGARELVFIFGANYLLIDKNTAVAFSLLFFILTALSSFIGIFLEHKLKQEIPGQAEKGVNG